jgi:hypothetical protein
MLAVDSAHQERGVGTALTTPATDRLRTTGMRVAAIGTGGKRGQPPLGVRSQDPLTRARQTGPYSEGRGIFSGFATISQAAVAAVGIDGYRRARVVDRRRRVGNPLTVLADRGSRRLIRRVLHDLLPRFRTVLGGPACGPCRTLRSCYERPVAGIRVGQRDVAQGLPPSLQTRQSPSRRRGDRWGWSRVRESRDDRAEVWPPYRPDSPSHGRRG